MANAVNLTKVSDELTRLDQVLAVFSTDRANSMVTVADALNQIKNVRTLNLTRVVSQLNDLADAIIRMDTEKLQTIAGSMSNMRGGAISIPRTVTSTTQTVGPIQGGTTDVGSRTVADLEQTETAVEDAMSRAETVMDNFGQHTSMVFARLRSVGVSVAKAIGNGFIFAGKKVLSLATGPFRMLYGAISRLGTPLQNFMRMFNRRLLYRLINAVISGISKAVKEGISNLYQYSKDINGLFAKSMDSMATSFLYLKNSIGAMLAPVLNALAPIIDRLVDKWVNMLNVINEALAKMTGAKTWTRALKYVTEYAEDADDAANKVKKLKNTILGIDEINLMNDKSATSIGSKKTQLDYSRMFEEVAVDIDESPMMSKLEKIKTAISKLFDPIKEGWQKYGQPVIDSFHGMVEKIKTLWDNIFGKVTDVWQKLGANTVVKNILNMVSNIFDFVGYVADTVSAALDELGENTIIAAILSLVSEISGFVSDILEDIIESDKQSGNLKETFTLIDGIISGIIGLFTTVISKIKEALKEGNRGEKLAQSISDFVNEILGFIQDIIDAVSEWLKEVDFGPLIDALTKILDALKDIIHQLRDIFKPLWDNFLKPLLDFLMEIGLPGVLEAIAGALEMVAGALAILSGVLNGNVDSILTGLDKLANGFLGLIKGALKTILGYFEFAINSWIKFFNIIPGVNIPEIDLTSWIDEKLWLSSGPPNMGQHIASGELSNIGASSTYTRQQAVDFANQFGMTVDEVMSNWNAAGMKYRGYASGGMPPQGTAFIAGEAGPEIVANINGRSGVMNVEQMSEGVAQGVRDANHEQNALLREQNALLRVLIDKEFSATAIVSTDDIIAGLQRNNRRNGRTIVPVGV